MKHDFTFTPSISLYIACTTEQEIDRLFEVRATASPYLLSRGKVALTGIRTNVILMSMDAQRTKNVTYLLRLLTYMLVQASK